MTTDIKHLGKTLLQIEREQLRVKRQREYEARSGNGVMKVAPIGDKPFTGRSFDMATVEESGKLSEGWDGALSADECAIAVNDPNGCASWLRGLADAIERGEHVGITLATVLMLVDGKIVRTSLPVRK